MDLLQHRRCYFNEVFLQCTCVAESWCEADDGFLDIHWNKMMGWAKQICALFWQGSLQLSMFSKDAAQVLKLSPLLLVGEDEDFECMMDFGDRPIIMVSVSAIVMDSPYTFGKLHAETWS